MSADDGENARDPLEPNTPAGSDKRPDSLDDPAAGAAAGAPAGAAGGAAGGAADSGQKWYANLPTLIGVTALGIIAVLCVIVLWRLSKPPETPLTQDQGVETTQATEQAQAEGQTQSDSGEQSTDASQPSAATDADTVANSTASATTLGLTAQIITAIGAIASTAVGGIAGLLIPRGSQGGT
jgi:hypothetical protein